MTADFTLRDEGTLVMLRPDTVAGRTWLDAHVPNAPRFGSAVVLEPQRILALLLALACEGLTVTT